MTKPHWLAPPGKTKLPPVVVCFDTETKWTTDTNGEVHTLRCWDAIVRGRHFKTNGKDQVLWAKGETAKQLADSLERASELAGETWAIAHNVGFDLTVTQLPVILAGRGWSPVFVHLGDESAVFVLKKGKSKLVITDSWSWLRCSLEDAAKDVKMRKVVLPEEQDDLNAWHRRCKHDVEILDRIMCEIMNWWEKENLGGFGTTGAACGWRAMRKVTQEKSILVGTEDGRTELEREAITGGMKAVYQVGLFHGSWIADYDLAGAYPTTAAAQPLPTQPYRPKSERTDLNPLDPPIGLDCIAEVIITTDQPCAPVRIDGEVWWPVGRFRAVLCGPELRHVATVAKVELTGRTQWYRTSGALADWAGWCLRLQNDFSGDTPAVVRRVAKGWGRSVIGRFALRTSELIMERPATHLGWHVESGHDLDTGQALQIISYGGTEYTYRQDVDGSEINPAILAFVEGYVRVAMATVLVDVEPARLLQVNTDGWWEKRANPSKSAATSDGPWPYKIVRKALTRTITVLGPNHVQIPTERRFAGIPRDAETNTKGKKVWLDWPGLKWQMENSEPGEYRRPSREAVLEEHYCKRWVLVNGETVPITTDLDSTGVTFIRPWSQAIGRWDTDELSPHQVTTLSHLVDDVPAIFLAPRGSGKRVAGRKGRII